MLATRQAHRLLLLPSGIFQLVTEHVAARPLRTPRLLAVLPQWRSINFIHNRVNNLSWGKNHHILRSLSIDVLRAATDFRELRDFPQRYTSFYKEYRRLVKKRTPPPATHIDWIVSMCLKSLSTHEDLVAAKAALQIYNDLTAGKWHRPPTLKDFASVITILCAVNAMTDAERYLKECLHHVPQDTLDGTIYSDIIRRYARRSNFDRVWLWYQDAKSRGVEVTPTIYFNVVDALLAQSDSVINRNILEVEEDVSRSEKMGTLGLLTVLVSVLDRLGQSKDAATAKNKLISLLSADNAFKRDDPLFIRAWTTIFIHIINRGEISMVKHLASLAQSKGYLPDNHAFTHILHRSDVNTVEDLQTLEEAFNLAAPAEAWGTLIRKILDREGVAAALDVYDASKAAGVRPLPASVNPLIHKMLVGRPNYLRIAWSDIQRAFVMYNDLVQAWNQAVGAPSREDKKQGQGQPWSNMASALTGGVERPEAESSILSLQTKWTKAPEQRFGGPDQATLDALLNALSTYASQANGFHRDDFQAEPKERTGAKMKDNKERRRGVVEELPLNDGRPTRRDVWKIALRLLEDMRTFRIEGDARFRSSFILLMIRLAPTFQNAFHVYRALVRGDRLDDSEAFEGFTADLAMLSNLQLKRFELNGVEWERIIVIFCHVREKRDEPGMSFPPAEMFVEMVRDMQIAGWPATEKMYMLYVGRLLRQARQLKVWQRDPCLSEDPEKESLEGLDEDEDAIWQGVTPSTFLDVRNSILHSIRHLHHHISVSAGITPSTKLLNAILEAYNRVAAMHDALKLWDQIWLSQIHDNWTVSVILDTCGWGKAGPRAAQIWNNLVATDFPLNKYNWDARVECLCRLGRLNDAVKVVCLEMPQQHLDNMARYEEYRRKLAVLDSEAPSPVRRQIEEQKAAVNEWGVMPDAATLNVLLSFAVQVNEVHQVKEKIRRYLPTLWNSLSEIDRRMWS